MQIIPAPDGAWPKNLLDVLIRAGLIVVLSISCYLIFYPFLNLMLWGMILAVTIYPLQRRLRPRLKNKDGRTATLIVTLAILILLVPIYLLGTSLAESADGAITSVRSGSLHVPPPADSVAQWPLVGKPLHAMWTQAATDMTGLMQKYAPQIKAASVGVLGKVAGVGVGLLMFVFALIIAGIFMAYGESGRHHAIRAASKVFGPGRGAHVAELCTATIRAVAQGVIGIAFIQMMLVLVGFILMGVPGAGLLGLAVLMLGILQIPATLITVPVIVFVFATEGASVATIAFAIYVFIAGLVDNVLKPLLLGRGVDVPMPVVLIGALGGMVTNGILGLFIGPVILAIGYELFWQWVDSQPEEPAGADEDSPPEMVILAAPAK